MRLSRAMILVVALALPGAVALAGPGGGAVVAPHTTATAVRTVPMPVINPVPAASSATANVPVDASVAMAADAGAPVETADQIARRKAYVDKTAAHIRDLVHANGKAVTDEERTAIERHWRHTMRLLRIRNLAELDSDTADIGRVDALMAVADAHLDSKLKADNIKAPKAASGGH